MSLCQGHPSVGRSVRCCGLGEVPLSHEGAVEEGAALVEAALDLLRSDVPGSDSAVAQTVRAMLTSETARSM